jgi:hypothetical protein
MNPGERIPGKFSCEAGRRPSGAAETLLVAKTPPPIVRESPRFVGRGGDR